MTDKELAIELANYINRQLTRIAALESILKTHDIPEWREDAARISQEPAFLQLSDEHTVHLQYSISDGIPESELIRALYRHFVER
jgi:hypothetical protein